MKLSLTFGAAGAIQASATTRTLAGELVRYGVIGRTSRGPLRVRAGALRFPDDLTRVKLTREHDRDASRGYLSTLERTDSGIRAALRVADGPEGDEAIAEAIDKTRDGLSFDVIDATVDGDEITDALVIAVGQVGIPAYEDSRIDTIAASQATSERHRMKLSIDQAAIFAELSTKPDLSDDEKLTLKALQDLAAAPDIAPPADPAAAPVLASVPAATGNPATNPVEVAASMPSSIPAGIPGPASATKATPRGGAYGKMLNDLAAAMGNGIRSASLQSITAALSDVTNSSVVDDIEPGEWAGELWSGLQYVPQFSDLFTQSSLTYWKGRGWRFTATPAMQTYAGDKAAIPTGTVTTEDEAWEAAREAVGVDIDRKFYDFGVDQAFLDGMFQKVRESWAIRLDAHIQAYMASKAVAATRTVNATRANGDATITSTAGAANLWKASDVGAKVTGTGIPANTTVLSFTNSGSIELSANATASGTSDLVVTTQEPTLLKAAARASLVLKRRRVGAATFVYVNDEDLFSLLDVNSNAVPAFLNLYGITPESFRSSPDIPQGTVWAGVKQAAEVKTLPGSPIRVSAQNLVNGGVDEAFFGYWAIQEHHTSGLAAVTFKAS
jgi:hypothetical protein